MYFCSWMQGPAGKCLKRSSPWHMTCISSLSIKDLPWGNFVIIPDGSTVILATPHEAHSGIIHCVWWPGNDSAIEKILTKCQHMPSHSTLSLKRTSFPMGSYQNVLVNNPKLKKKSSLKMTLKKSLFVDLLLGSEPT